MRAATKHVTSQKSALTLNFSKTVLKWDGTYVKLDTFFDSSHVLYIYEKTVLATA